MRMTPLCVTCLVLLAASACPPAWVAGANSAVRDPSPQAVGDTSPQAVRDASPQAVGDTSPQTSQPAPDLLGGAIDPYQPGIERAAFFKAAGVDNELDAKEFASALKAARGPQAQPGGAFIRPFDDFAAMLVFDKNHNGTIDWFEAEAYRQDVRKRVLAAFDANRYGGLTGKERSAANNMLAAGRLPGKPPAIPERVRIDDPTTAPSDGQDATPQADKGRQAWQETVTKWRLKNFDADGDGKLDEQEQAEADKFDKQLRDVGQSMQLRMADLDGDGQVSEEEQQAVRKEWQKESWTIFAKSFRYMDADGDGQISLTEREAFQRRMQSATVAYIEKFSTSFDADHDGRLNAKERESLISGMARQLEQRTAKFDADHDGRLNPAEAINMMEDFVQQDLGLHPSAPATQPAK